ncbi:MAG: hypothetical protein IKW30_10940 [Lachnospiraceae bacterium]|nr:hypothetical protein [Lachnospiraceae bacterium]
MTKMVVFDMDGTIANLYGVENWLEYIHNEDPYPYKVAECLYDPVELLTVVNELKANGWKIAITSWLAKGGSKEYNAKVRQAKIEWLSIFPYDEIHIVKYGTTKANCTRGKADFQILVDDNEMVRNSWNLGGTIDANKNILKELRKLLDF